MTYANKNPKELLLGGDCDNFAFSITQKECSDSENYFLGSYVNIAKFNMEESEVSASANYAEQFLGNSLLGNYVILP